MGILKGRTSLVTGASRGIGAVTAIRLAGMGSNVVLNFRSKGGRAEDVAWQIAALGAAVLPVQADLTVETEVAAMMAATQERFGRLDILVLNASGGLEKGKADDYAMALNLTAQLRTAELAADLMTQGGRIVFVTSHWAHFYGKKPVMAAYEEVARSKHAGEQALREYCGGLGERGISLVVVSGDLIDGTITPRLLERQSPGLIEHRRSEAKSIPTVGEFAHAIVRGAVDPELVSGHTIFVGSTEY